MIWKLLILLRWRYGRGVPCGQEGVRSGVWVDGEWGWGWDRCPDLHTQSLIHTCWSTTCITLIKTQAEGGGRERKDAFAGVADLEKGARS